MKWTKNCATPEIYKTPEIPANPNANAPNPLIQATSTTTETFQISNARIYVPVVTLSINNNINFLEKQGFKRTIFWNKYRSDNNNNTKKKQ